MADKNRSKDMKEVTPPPLLLMPASGGLTLNPTQGGNFLMPVPTTEQSFLPPDEEAEADSFVGQGPDISSNIQSSQVNFFQTGAAHDTDPFANLTQQDHAIPSVPSTLPMMPPAVVSSQMPPPSVSPQVPPPAMLPPSSTPPMFNTSGSGTVDHVDAPPPRGPVQNFHRQAGPMRYAPPPEGTYATVADIPMTTSPQLNHPEVAQLPVSQPAVFQPPNAGPTPSSIPVSGSIPAPALSGSPADMMPNTGTYTFKELQHHWFYCENVELRQIWKPYSIIDSIKLENASMSDYDGNLIVSTDGGRYDTDLTKRIRIPVYWEDNPNQVRRCSWFFKNDGDSRFIPYEEDFATELEKEYLNAVTNNIWHKRLEFPGGETIVIHNPNVIVHFRPSSQPDEWGTTQSDSFRPRVVKRGIDDFAEVADGEPVKIDHVVFVVHGIGPTCDLRFRNIVECVNDIRNISLQILQSHFRRYQTDGKIGRVEFLPVRWHTALHGDATGVDRKMKAITLKSIAKLRHFTNDTLLDILFYSSPHYAQKIADAVGCEINRLSQLFRKRNPVFKGDMSVSGHSLGSLILFDLLAHQQDPTKPLDLGAGMLQEKEKDVIGVAHIDLTDNSQAEDLEELQNEAGPETMEELLVHLGLSDYLQTFQKEQIDIDTLTMCEEADIKEIGLPMGPRKKLQGYLKELKQRKEQEKSQAKKKLQEEMAKNAKAEQELQAAELHSQKSISHDPLLRSASNASVDYVVANTGTGSPLVNYPQLDFDPINFFALGSPIPMFLTVRGVENLGEDFQLPTCAGFFNIFHPFDPVAYRLEPLLTAAYPVKPMLMPHHKGRKRLHLELRDSLGRVGADLKQRFIDSVKTTWKSINDFASAHRSTPQEVDSVLNQLQLEDEEKLETASVSSSCIEEDIPVGSLNQGRRVDYVLQEKPIESFNDYLFALGSHMCYWESEDTVLLMLKEIYSLMGITPQKPGEEMTSPQQTRSPTPPMSSPKTAMMTGSPMMPPPSQHTVYNRDSSLSTGSNIPPPTFSHANPVIPSSATTGLPPSSMPMSPPSSTGHVGPPPMSGFMRSPPRT